MTRHLAHLGLAFAVVAVCACNGANGHFEADEPEADYVTVTIASPGTLWLEDLPLIEIRRGRSSGYYGYEVWFEVEGTRQVQFWRRTAIDLGDGAVVPAHAGRWGTFNGEKVYYPGTITAETAPRIHDGIMWVEQHFRGQAEGGIAAMEWLGIVATVGSLAPASAGSSAAAAGGATAKALPAGRSVWSLGWAERGRRIEQALGGNLPSNYPVIDKFVRGTGVAISIKSLDLAAKSYQSSLRVYSRVKGVIDKLARFKGRTWANVDIDEADIVHRILTLAVPNRGTAIQQRAIQRAAEYARKLGVELQVVVFP
ncbi:MAG: hypothetical protein Tsb0020_01470 [Haliangiales bacterium]